MKKNEQDEYLTDIKNEQNPIRKQQLLQKYGLMIPKLTEKEQDLCKTS